MGTAKTERRFNAAMCGRKMNGQPNFGCNDCQPALGSDGRLGDFDTLAEAQAWADELQARWEREVAARKDGRVWRTIQNRYNYAWLEPLPDLNNYLWD